MHMQLFRRFKNHYIINGCWYILSSIYQLFKHVGTLVDITSSIKSACWRLTYIKVSTSTSLQKTVFDLILISYVPGENCLMLKHPSFPDHTDDDHLMLFASPCTGLKSVICEQQLYLSNIDDEDFKVNTSALMVMNRTGKQVVESLHYTNDYMNKYDSSGTWWLLQHIRTLITFHNLV